MNDENFTALITAGQLHRRLRSPGWVVADCRFELANPQAGEEAYRAGHIPGAVYAHLDRDLSSPITPSSGRHPLPAAAAFAATLGRWGISNECQVVCYDEASGAIAARLWWMLRWLGHTRVAVLDGGIGAWKAAGHTLDRDVPAPAAAEFRPRADRKAWLTTAEVVAGLRRNDFLLVDARAADRYEGRNETIDTRAGHVPGARSHPFTTNLDSAGRFLPGDELRRRWIATLGDAQRQVVCMCGSGVTACHDLLALEAAGMPTGRLYAGSWSEWIRDPGRPAATGPLPGGLR